MYWHTRDAITLPSTNPDIASDAWTLQIAHRGGCIPSPTGGILYAMWRDEAVYDAHRIRPRPPLRTNARDNHRTTKRD